jgi:Domain of unknown function (DUF4160)
MRRDSARWDAPPRGRRRTSPEISLAAVDAHVLVPPARQPRAVGSGRATDQRLLRDHDLDVLERRPTCPAALPCAVRGRASSIGLDGEVIAGALPARALSLVTEWAQMHREELEANWERARRDEPLQPIDPLP